MCASEKVGNCYFEKRSDENDADRSFTTLGSPFRGLINTVRITQSFPAADRIS